MSFGLCIAGCGKWARNVLESTPGLLQEVDLLFASRDLDKAREFSEAFGGGGFFGSYEEAASDARVDGLYFTTPHHLHVENAKLAARHKKPLMVEKPIARTMAEGREMVQVTRDAGVKLMVAENYRFLNTVNKAKELLTSGAIGDLRLIQVQVQHQAQDTSGWRASADLRGGGIVIDSGIHYIDIMVNVGGFPESVYALIPPKSLEETEGEDGIVMTVGLAQGAVGLLSIYLGTPITEQQTWTHITGTQGQVRFQPDGSEVTLDTLTETRTFQVGEGHRGLLAMVREFRDCVVEDREPAMTGEEGLKDLAVVLEAYRSAKQGKAVQTSLPS